MKPALIISTYPDKSRLNKIANQLVRSRVAACVNIYKISSIYMWKGKVENSPEYIGIFKTTHKNKKKLKEMIKTTHPYEIPEIVELDITSINKPYLDWLVDSTSQTHTA